jgi:DNA-binding beta-propeller fold protein YncE
MSWFTHGSSRCPAGPTDFRRYRPALEVLEDRTVLSVVSAGSGPHPPAVPVAGATAADEVRAEVHGQPPAGSEKHDRGKEDANATYDVAVIATGLVRPTGITASRAPGRDALYFTELPQPGVSGGSNSVDRLSPTTGAVTALVTGEPAPTNLAQDERGNLYWTCASAGVIVKLTPSGQMTVLLKGLAHPTGIAVDPEGQHLYYTEVPTPGVGGGNGGMNRVTRVDLKTMTTTVIHAGDPEPVDVAVAPNGDLYWTCRSAGVIVHYTAHTRQSNVILSGLARPTGIALDRSGDHLYFTEVPTPGVGGGNGGMNRVSRLDLGSMKVTTVHVGDPEPTDVTVDAHGTVYWTCSSAGVIVRARLVDHDDDEGGHSDGQGHKGDAGKAKTRVENAALDPSFGRLPGMDDEDAGPAKRSAGAIGKHGAGRARG